MIINQDTFNKNVFICNSTLLENVANISLVYYNKLISDKKYFQTAEWQRNIKVCINKYYLSRLNNGWSSENSPNLVNFSLLLSTATIWIPELEKLQKYKCGTIQCRLILWSLNFQGNFYKKKIVLATVKSWH